MRDLGAMALLAMMAQTGPAFEHTRIIRDLKEPKKCLLCGKEHYHNGGFCCAEHCKEWKNKRINK